MGQDESKNGGTSEGDGATPAKPESGAETNERRMPTTSDKPPLGGASIDEEGLRSMEADKHGTKKEGASAEVGHDTVPTDETLISESNNQMPNSISADIKD